MPSKKRSLLAASGAGGDSLYVEDVFSTYLYTGADANETVTNGIDLDGEGGFVWIKPRTTTGSHLLYDTERGIGTYLQSHTTAAASSAVPLGSFNSDGFTTFAYAPAAYVSWSFRKAEKFFDVVEFEAPTSASDNFRVSHNLGSVPACIIVKSVDVTGDWYVYHSSLETPRNDSLKLNTTAASAASGDFWGEANPTTTDFGVQVRNFGTRPVTTSAGTYIAYLFASDAGGFGDDEDENIVKCGSFSGIGQVDLGFEPQFLLYKPYTQNYDWELADNMRRLDGVSSSVLKLEPNSDAAEANGSEIKINATGFYNGTFGSTYPCIYIAIRRPMKTPESGTEVFSATTQQSTYPNWVTGFPVDWMFYKNIDNGSGDWFTGARLIGTERGRLNTTEDFSASSLMQWDYQNGQGEWSTSADPTAYTWNFKRATGFFDVVAYTGTGAGLNVAHNLGVAPEMIWVKNRDSSYSWTVYAAPLGTSSWLYLETASAASTANNPGFNAIGDTTFGVGSSVAVNGNTQGILAYLFATLAGVSKVGSYTGTGADLNVDCGFTAGARFILIKRTDSTGDWYVWDSSRGISASTDPYLLLNSTAAEVTNTDYIDPLSSGFTVTSSAPAGLNASSGTYIFLAIA